MPCGGNLQGPLVEVTVLGRGFHLDNSNSKGDQVMEMRSLYERTKKHLDAQMKALEERRRWCELADEV